jgi:glucose-6-phosphate 1-dehydrogenase
VIRGQYAAGTIQRKSVPGYTAEPNIAATSLNDTFIAAKLQIDAPFWRGVPFYIRTGKRMKEKSTRIVVEFKEPLKQRASVHEGNPLPNLLVFEMSPHEGITLQLNTRDPQHKGEFKPIHIEFHSSSRDLPEAYENLLYDALLGNPAFFAHWDEVELSWIWVEPILQAFEENLVPLHLYPAGTYGPAESDALLAKHGYHWWFDSNGESEIQEIKGEQYAYHTNY